MPGKLNSSDLATRSTLEAEELIPAWWLEEPAFLKESEEHWPKDIPWIKIKEEIRTNTESNIYHLARSSTSDRTPLEIIGENIIRVIKSAEFEESGIVRPRHFQKR